MTCHRSGKVRAPIPLHVVALSSCYTRQWCRREAEAAHQESNQGSVIGSKQKSDFLFSTVQPKSAASDGPAQLSDLPHPAMFSTDVVPDPSNQMSNPQTIAFVIFFNIPSPAFLLPTSFLLPSLHVPTASPARLLGPPQLRSPGQCSHHVLPNGSGGHRSEHVCGGGERNRRQVWLMGRENGLKKGTRAVLALL